MCFNGWVYDESWVEFSQILSTLFCPKQTQLTLLSSIYEIHATNKARWLHSVKWRALPQISLSALRQSRPEFWVLLWTNHINCFLSPKTGSSYNMSHVCLAARLNICQNDRNAKKWREKEEKREGEGNQAEPFVFAQFATDYASCKFTTACVCVWVCVVWHNWIRHFGIIIADIRTSAYMVYIAKASVIARRRVAMAL